MPDDQEQQQGGEPPAWENVAADFQAAFPDHDPAYLERRYRGAVALRQARRDDDEQGDDYLHRFGYQLSRRMPWSQYIAPVIDSGVYNEARRRYQDGDAAPENLRAIARYERHQREDGQAGIGEDILRVPAGAAEWLTAARLVPGGPPQLGAANAWIGSGAAAGTVGGITRASLGTVGRLGLTTALNPSQYVPEWFANNQREGRDLTDPRGLPTAFGMGLMQTAVLGNLGQHFPEMGGQGISGLLARNGARVGAGMLEMEAANTVGHLLGWRTEGGTIQQLLDGGDQAERHLISDVISLAAFSLLHEVGGRRGAGVGEQPAPGAAAEAGAPTPGVPPGGPPGEPPPLPRPTQEQVRSNPVMEAWAEAHRRFGARGIDRNTANDSLQGTFNELRNALRENPNIDPEELRSRLLDVSAVQGYDFARSLADAYETHFNAQGREAPPTQEEANGRPREPGPAQDAWDNAWHAGDPNWVPRGTEQPTAQPSGAPLERLAAPETRPAEKPAQTPRERANELEQNHKQALAEELDARRALNRANQGMGDVREARKELSKARKRREQIARDLDQAGHEAAMADIEAAKGGGTAVAEPSPDQRWNNTGTAFRDIPGRPIEFTASDGRTYTIEHRENVGSLDHRVSIHDQAGNEVAHAGFNRNADGTFSGHVSNKAGPKGMGRALYDFAHTVIGDLKPSTSKIFGGLQTEEGKAMWARNAEFAAKRPVAAAIADPTPEKLVRAANDLGSHPNDGMLARAGVSVERVRSMAHEIPLHEIADAKRLGISPASLRRIQHALLQKEVAAAQAAHARERGQASNVAGALARTAQVGGGGAQAGGIAGALAAPARGPAGSNELSQFFGAKPQQGTIYQQGMANTASGWVQPVAQPKAEPLYTPNVPSAPLRPEGAPPEWDSWSPFQRQHWQRSNSPWIKENVRLRNNGERTLADEIIKRGGIDPKSLEGDVEHWKDVFGPGMFKSKGGKGQKLDELAEELQRRFPGEFRDETVHPTERVLEMLAEHFLEDGGRAAERLAASDEIRKARDDFGREYFAQHPAANEAEIEAAFNQVLGQASDLAGRDQPTIQAIASATGEAGQPEAPAGGTRVGGRPDAGAGRGEAYEPPGSLARVLGGEHGAAGVGPAGANVPGQPPAAGAQAPGAGVGPGGIADQWSDAARRAAMDWMRDESGHLDINNIQDWIAKKWDEIKRVGQYIADNYRELAGNMFPRLTRANRASGEALARFVAARSYARLAAPVYLDKVMGPNVSAHDRLLAGAVLTERRLRYMRQHFLRIGDTEAARNVTSIIGKEGSPLQTLDDYRRALASPLIDGVMRRWNNDFVPVMEDNYRRAQGMEEDDPIHGPTQVPGSPVNLKPFRPGDENLSTVIPTGAGGRGDLKNVKLRKFKFAQTATGAAEGYDIDLGSMIENALSHGLTNAAKAEAMRTMVANGVARWGVPGARLEGATEIPEVKPPRGTQEATKGQTSLYVDDAAADEFRRSLQVDKPLHLPGITDLAPVFNGLTLASTVEAAYHSKNMLTFLMKPGIRPQDFVRNIFGVWNKTPWVGQRLMEIARIGAGKENFPITGYFGGGRSDPTTWMQRVIHFMRQTMELTADDAFTRLAQKGLVEDTETNRRNFINQLGQYHKAAQNKWVVALRDSQLGPFATAGTNYWIQKLRSLTMYGGVPATSSGAAFKMRLGQLSKTLALLGFTVPILNKLMWGRFDGDDDTPFGSLKIGHDENGRTRSIGVANLIGFVGGLRETGLLALIEGTRRGQPIGRSIDRGVENIVGSALHPAEGPVVQFLHTAITGTNAIHMKLADRVGPDESHALSNLWAAFRQANPVASAMIGEGIPGHRQEEIPWNERINQLAGPFGLQYRGGHVNDVMRRFHELSGPRSAQMQRGLTFEHEREYQIISHAHQRIMQIDQTLRSLHRVGPRLRPFGSPLSPEDRQELLQRQRDIARSALEAAAQR